MADVDYRESFANRLRSLRIAAGLSLEEASGRGGLSTNFWGNVERNEQEACLNTIFSLAKGLGITASVLIALDDKDRQPPRSSGTGQLARSPHPSAVAACDSGIEVDLRLQTWYVTRQPTDLVIDQL